MNRPEIKNVTISPNPANAKTSIKVSIQVEDKAITFNKETVYAGEIYAGQQIGVV